MLEMILSSEQGRLSERITKFLVTQVSNIIIIVFMFFIVITGHPHHLNVLDPSGLEALAQQEHRPLRFEAGKRPPLLRLGFPPGHHPHHSHHHPRSKLSTTI